VNVDEERAAGHDREPRGTPPLRGQPGPGQPASAVAPEEGERGRPGDKAGGGGSSGLNGRQGHCGRWLKRPHLGQDGEPVHDLLLFGDVVRIRRCVLARVGAHPTHGDSGGGR
jgi:hypothetical protein